MLFYEQVLQSCYQEIGEYITKKFQGYETFNITLVLLSINSQKPFLFYLFFTLKLGFSLHTIELYWSASFEGGGMISLFVAKVIKHRTVHNSV